MHIIFVYKNNNFMQTLLEQPFYQTLIQKALSFVIGTVLIGLLLGGIYLLSYLYNIYKLPRNSRSYLMKKEHMEGQTLLRYCITVGCILALNLLIYFFLDGGQTSMHMGMAVWILYFVGIEIAKKIKNARQKGNVVTPKAL